jgi:putative transcriptional regulator
VVDTSLTGALLVASPTLADPNFARSVVLLLDHDEEGALGVILNRPSEVTTSDVVPLPRTPGWADLVSEPAVVHVGGPVTPEAIVCLGRMSRMRRMRADADNAGDLSGWTPLGGLVGAIDLDADPDDLLAALDGLRVFAGYSGWGPGQLEHELRIGGWLVLGAEPDDPFTADPATLWSRVLRRQGGELALLHTMPADPTHN